MIVHLLAKRTSVLVALVVAAVACAGPETLVLAPSELSTTALAPHGTRFNRTTSSPWYSTRIAKVGFTPSSTYGGHASGEVYELRFSYYGYTGAHTEPQYTFVPPGRYSEVTHRKEGYDVFNLEGFTARMRDGSTDSLGLRICVHEFNGSRIFVGCRGDDNDQGYVFRATDNNRVVDVPFTAEETGQGTLTGTFHITLSWVPVNIQPSTVFIESAAATSAGLFLNVGGQGTELVARAYDATGQDVPGLPISWSNSDPSVVGVAENGWIWPVAPGTAYVTATIGGVSGTRRVTVNTNLSVDILGPTAMRPNESCTFTGSVTSTDYVDPLTYSWRGPGGATGVGEQYVAPSSASTYNLTLTVTDATGRTGSKTKTIRAASGNPSCHQFQQ